MTRAGIHVGDRTRVSRRATIDASDGGGIFIGNNCNIHDYAMLLTYGGGIWMGDRCTVNPFLILYGHGGLTLGNGVRIATHCVIIPGTHNYSDPERFIYGQGMTCRGIVLEDDVWLGAGVRILDGVTVGRGAVVGSGAVVTKSVSPYAIVGGVPAKILSYRGEHPNHDGKLSRHQ